MKLLKDVKWGIYVALALFVLHACKPVIRSFLVTPLTITDTQKVFLNWDIKGTGHIEFNEHKSVDSIDLLQFTLLVKRGMQEARKSIEVMKLKSIDTIDVAFETIRRQGDTIEANGENNVERFKNFKVVTVLSAMNRVLLISHEGREADLSPDGQPSSIFAGTLAGGCWNFRTKLTQKEILDSSIIPPQLSIKIVIKPLKP